MKYVIVCFIILFSAFNVHAKTYVQDKNGNWHGYDDGCPCVNTYVTADGEVINAESSVGVCCTCCG
jgi:hypothetical protein